MDVIPINMDALTSIWIERDQKIQAKKNERITHRSLLPDLIFCAFFFLNLFGWYTFGMEYAF